jgi:Arc/MetJ-type ribon-helix-helix transcriptional regulator
MNKPKTKYKTISLTKPMVEEIEQAIKEHPEKGYTSVADFVRRALTAYYEAHKNEH